ncbi:hypothetical protein [Mesorhizobium sp. B2-3-6]|uniref:hypothetical protein n=1 Tax=Mesorhizobium sp. B2-3-6 TaxID=2589957 RepID=UPI00112B6D13|nr:hypothetical protein [Mesorhizobium sp. B2-3-6]TPM19813.1 hypothetical protein FJ953_15545 [Mesorhizobium sp. B2-3-6]
MTKLYVQVLRGKDWLNVTSVPIDDGKTERDRVRYRERALDDARRNQTAWQGYSGFDGCQLRIAEMDIYGRYAEARP